MRHEISAQLALVTQPATPTHCFVLWESSDNGDLSYFHPEALASPARPGHVNTTAVPNAAVPAVLDWLLARFALNQATAEAEDHRTT